MCVSIFVSVKSKRYKMMKMCFASRGKHFCKVHILQVLHIICIFSIINVFVCTIISTVYALEQIVTTTERWHSAHSIDCLFQNSLDERLEGQF